MIKIAGITLRAHQNDYERVNGLKSESIVLNSLHRLEYIQWNLDAIDEAKETTPPSQDDGQ